MGSFGGLTPYALTRQANKRLLMVGTVTWPKTYVMGSAITGRLEAPITPITTTIVTATAGTFGTDSRGSTVAWTPAVTGTYGARTVFTSTQDLSAYQYIGMQMGQTGFPFSSNGNNPSKLIDTLANGGMSLVWFDSGGNWSEFYFYGDAFDAGNIEIGGWQQFRGPGSSGCLQLAIDKSKTPDANSGTLDWSLIDGVELIMRTTSTNGSANIQFGSFMIFDPIELTGGTGGSPATFEDFVTYGETDNSGYNYRDTLRNTAGIFNGGIGELYEPVYTYRIGDGSTTTVFRDSGSQLAPYPDGYTSTATLGKLYLNGVDRGFEINTSASCDIEFNGTIIPGPDVSGGQHYTEVLGNTSGAVVWTNCQFYRQTSVKLTHSTATGGVFDDCEAVEVTADTTLTTGIFRNSAATSQGLRYTGVAADKSAITCDFNSNLGIDLSVGSGGAGTYTFSGLTTSGGHTLNVWNESVSNSATVELAAGTSNQPIDLWFGYDNEASGPFSEGEVLTFANGATATLVVLQDNGTTGAMYCELLTGSTPPDNNGITGGTSSATADVDEAGGANKSTLTISSPAVTFTINSSESASQIIVFTTATQTELDSESSASQLVFEHSSQTVDYTVMKAGFIPQRFTGVVLSGTSSVTVNLVASREYDASHGLTYTTDASWSRSLNELTVPTFGVTGRGVFSLMIDSFISESALRNTAFNIEMDGSGSFYLVNDAEGATAGDVENLADCGVGYYSTAGVLTASWSGLNSVGTATGFTGEYQQVDGSGTTDARASGVFKEAIKVYGDVTHGNFDYRGHLVAKYQVNGYYQARIDVLNAFGISALEPTLYIVPMEPAATGIATGDPAISITITDHTAAPITVGGKNFDYEVVDNGTNTAEDILREINYNLSLDATYQGKDPFNYPDMVIELGGNYETEIGKVEGQDTTTTDHGFYVSRSAADHPGITRFQSNDGTYYVPAVQNQATITNLLADDSDRRLYIYNSTTASVIYNDVPSTTYSDTYIEGTDYTDGDQVLIRWAQANGTTDFKSFSTIITASSTGWSLDASNFIAENSTYATLGIDGSLVTGHTADYIDDEVDITSAANFSGENTQAWMLYILTTSQGITDFWGGFTIGDGFIQIHNATVSMYMDNTSATNIRETSNLKIFRDDAAYPVKGGGVTSGGGGIDLRYLDPVYTISTGSGLSAGQAAQLTAIEGKTDPLTYTVANKVDANAQYMSDSEVLGDGSSGDKWRGV